MIPLSVPNLNGNELDYVKDCLDTNWVSSVGSYVDRFESAVAEFTGVKYAISTMNGTAALHISMLLAGVNQNDYVIVPNVTFIASLNSISYLKASPILVDVHQDTWQMNLDLLEEFLNTNTIQKNSQCCYRNDGRVIKAIMPVHVLGNMCDMDRLLSICRQFSISMIEDASESLGSTYKNKHAGSFGLLGCLSFNGNKIITTGGGGMILTDNEKLAKRAKHITTQAKSDSFEYIHDEIGYNYRLVNILAALGVAQLEQLPSFLIKKSIIAERYNSELEEIPGFAPQKISKYVRSNNWLQTFKFDKPKVLMENLTNLDIQVRPFWVPMNALKMFSNEIYITKHDVSSEVYRDCVSLPCSTNISDEDQMKVINSIKKFYNV